MNYKKNTHAYDAVDVILGVFAFLLALAGTALFVAIITCVISDDKSEQNCANQYFDLVLLERDGHNSVYYDRNTNVMYFSLSNSQYENGLTPIYNADGTLKLYESDER